MTEVHERGAAFDELLVLVKDFAVIRATTLAERDTKMFCNREGMRVHVVAVAGTCPPFPTAHENWRALI